MLNLADVIASLEHLAPLRLAADWDNVGLLVATQDYEHAAHFFSLAWDAEPSLTDVRVFPFFRFPMACGPSHPQYGMG